MSENPGFGSKAQMSNGGNKPLRPFLMRRGPMENIATALIGLGFLMLFQPFWLTLYTWSFVVMLMGTALFIVVSKFSD